MRALALPLTLALLLAPAGARAQSWEAAPAPPPVAQRLPLGSTHVGLQFEGGLALTLTQFQPGGHVVVGAIVDFVAGLHETFRLVFFVESTTLPGVEYGAAGARFLFGFDQGPMTLRFGGELGPTMRISTANADFGAVSVSPDAQLRIELVGRLLEARDLEIGIALHAGIDEPPIAFADLLLGWLFE